MESVRESMDYELRVLHAAADGVEPALLLSAPGKKAEYLLNVPDGFSRLALEHKSTPSGRLSCILLTSLLPAATGGLGGLMLRLRHDGHGQVQMIGPSGTTAMVHSLRHICRWQHPKVFVSECCGNRPFPVFEDEHIVIVPIVKGCETTGCPWCLYGTSDGWNSEQQKKTSDRLARASSNGNCSTSCSSESSVATEDSSDTDCSCDEEVSRDVRGSSSILPHWKKRGENLQLPSDGERSFFKQVRLKLDKSKRERMNVFGVLPAESCKKQPPANRITSESGPMPTLRSSTQEEEKETTFEQVETGESGIGTSGCGEQPISPVGSEGGKKQNHVFPVKRFEWLIHTSQDVELPNVDEEANPVFQLSPNPDKQQDTVSGESRSTEPVASSVLGYVCYLRKLGTAVLILDCKSKEHLETLRAHPLLRCSYCPGLAFKEGDESKAGNDHLVAAVVDLSPPNIIQSRDYKHWLESLRSSGPHVVVKGAHGEFGFQSSLATLVKLNGIHKRMFPLPPGMMDACSKVTPASSNQAVSGKEKVLDAPLCMRLILQKSGTAVDYSLCPVKLTKLQEERRQMALDCSGTGGDEDEGVPASGTPSTVSANGAAAAALRRSLQQRKAVNLPSNPSLQRFHCQGSALSKIQQEDLLQSSDCSEQYNPNSHRTSTSGQEEMGLSELACDFQLVFFGTGCAEPSKKRGSSGILLQVRGTDRAMLMEAGEGVAGQFVRRFGDVRAQSFICSLECLWLSHKHGDHVLGVISILEARMQQKELLVVIGPQKVGNWLSEVKGIRAAMGCPVPEFHFIHCQDLAVPGRPLGNKQDRKQFDRVLSGMQLQSLRLVRVFHCFDAYGIILRGKTGWSIVYSGDTRPCKPLEYAGQGCSLLIHEATFEDELIEQARQKRHCTVSEALKAGMQMGAQHIILTHFSQRYPEMVAMSSDYNQRVSVAFDGMVVPSHLLDSLSQLLPLITSACQKVDKTESLVVSDQVMDEDHSKPNNHVLPAQANILTHPTTDELEDHGSGPTHPVGASLHSSLTGLNTEYQDGAGVKPKHMRWSDDGDHEDVTSPPLDLGHATEHVAAIKWSSDSEEGPFRLPVLKGTSGPQIRSVESNTEAYSKPTLVTARATNFDAANSSATGVSGEDEEGCCWLTDRPRRRQSRDAPRRGFMNMPRKIARRGGIETSVDHFLKHVERYENVSIAGMYDCGEESRPPRISVEGRRAHGGKHIRRIDSDTED